MANNQLKGRGENISSAQAVFLEALAPSVNAPTWTTLRLSFVMLGVCLVVMLGLAFSSSDSWLVFHVAFLVLIATTLFLLLSWFVSQAGLVTVENKKREIGLALSDQGTSRKNTMKIEELKGRLIIHLKTWLLNHQEDGSSSPDLHETVGERNSHHFSHSWLMTKTRKGGCVRVVEKEKRHAQRHSMLHPSYRPLSKRSAYVRIHSPTPDLGL